MENDDLASRIASRLDEENKRGRVGKRRSKREARDRLKLWITGEYLCDPETATVLPNIRSLREWYMRQGLGYLSESEGADLWADVLLIGETVGLEVWRVCGDWYYDRLTGLMLSEH